MFFKNIPYLSWDFNNLAKFILYHQFSSYFYGFNSSSTSFPRFKHNQFNIKWNFSRFLKSYYSFRFKHSPFFLESRVDLILFRSNWFLSHSSVLYAIKHRFVYLNHNLISHPHFFLSSGDLLSFSLFPSPPFLSFLPPSSPSLFLWSSHLPFFLFQNVDYILINNNIKSLLFLHSPFFHSIPFPFNLHKFHF